MHAAFIPFSEMERPLVISLILLACLLVLCILSKTVSGNSRLGNHSETTVKTTCMRLYREATVLRATSHQDELPAQALAHNAEALACVRASQALAQEYGMGQPDGMQDLAADLRDEQEASVTALASEMGDR